MKKRKAGTILTLLSITFLTACGSRPSDSAVSPALTPVSSLSPIQTATPIATITSAPAEPAGRGETAPTETAATPEPTPTPEPTEIPEPNTACMYVNYANAFPLIVTNDYSVEFHYDDTVTVTGDNNHLYEFSLSQSIVSDEVDFSDSSLWYFCGAFQSENIVYAHFDYLNNSSMTPSLLVKIDLNNEAADASCCILSYNPKKHFQDSFTTDGEYIYYTNTYYTDYGTATTDIVRTDKNGENRSVYYEGTLGETIRYMTCDGNYLSYVITDLNEVHRLISVELSSGNETLLTNRLAQPDFLIGWNGYVLTSIQNSRLTYFDCADGDEGSIAYTSNTSITAGYPLTDGKNVYLPLINYSGNNATALCPVDLSSGSALDPIQLSDTYYYSVGMIDEYLYTENVDDFLVFDITIQN